MEIKYNLTGTDRKALVKAVSNIIGEKSKYLGAPSFAYQIGDDCTMWGNGVALPCVFYVLNGIAHYAELTNSVI